MQSYNRTRLLVTLRSVIFETPSGLCVHHLGRWWSGGSCSVLGLPSPIGMKSGLERDMQGEEQLLLGSCWICEPSWEETEWKERWCEEECDVEFGTMQGRKERQRRARWTGLMSSHAHTDGVSPLKREGWRSAKLYPLPVSSTCPKSIILFRHPNTIPCRVQTAVIVRPSDLFSTPFPHYRYSVAPMDMGMGTEMRWRAFILFQWLIMIRSCIMHHASCIDDWRASSAVGNKVSRQ